MALGNHNIRMNWPMEVSSVRVRLDHMDLDFLIWAEPVPPCKTNISFPSSPIFRELKEFGVLTKPEAFMVKIPCTYVQVPIAVQI